MMISITMTMNNIIMVCSELVSFRGRGRMHCMYYSTLLCRSERTDDFCAGREASDLCTVLNRSTFRLLCCSPGDQSNRAGGVGGGAQSGRSNA